MSSGDRSGREGGTQIRAIVLSVDQFEVIYQLAHQLLNFQESRLVEFECTNADLQKLIATLRQIDARTAEASRVRIILGDYGTENPAEVRFSVSEVDDSGGPRSVVWATLPSHIGGRLHALAQLVVSALGARELFLRTGYNPDEVKAAVRELDVDRLAAEKPDGGNRYRT